MNLLKDIYRSAKKVSKYDAPTSFAGIPITIENPIGSTRSGRNKQGKEWSVKMNHHYGFIRTANGADGEGLDCFVNSPCRGDGHATRDVYVIHQNDPSTGMFDEDKVMLGFRSPEEAKAAYLSNYDTPKFYRSMTIVPISRFKQMLTKGEPGSIHWKKKHGRPLQAHAMFSSDQLLNAVSFLRKAKGLSKRIARFAAEEEAESKGGDEVTDAKTGQKGHWRTLNGTPTFIAKGQSADEAVELAHPDHPLHDRKTGVQHEEGRKGASLSKQLGMFGGQAGQEVGALTGSQQSMFGKEPPKEKADNSVDGQIARKFDPSATEEMFGKDAQEGSGELPPEAISQGGFISDQDIDTATEGNSDASNPADAAGAEGSENPEAEGLPAQDVQAEEQSAEMGGASEPVDETQAQAGDLQQSQLPQDDSAEDAGAIDEAESSDMPDDFLNGIEPDEGDPQGLGEAEAEIEAAEIEEPDPAAMAEAEQGAEGNAMPPAGGEPAQPEAEGGEGQEALPSPEQVAQAANRGDLDENDLLHDFPHLAGSAMVERHRREAKAEAMAEKAKKEAAAQGQQPGMTESPGGAPDTAGVADEPGQAGEADEGGTPSQPGESSQGQELSPEQQNAAMSNSAIERTLQAYFDETSGESQQAIQDDKDLSSFGDPYKFSDKTGGMKGEMAHMKEGGGRKKNVMSEGSASGGGAEDAIGELGEDKYRQIANRRTDMTGRKTKALEYAKKSPDPKIRLLAAIHETFNSNESENRRQKKQPVPASSLKTGTSGTINGIPVEVVDEGGEKILKDGGDLPETPLDALAGTNIPFDKKSLNTGTAAKAEAPAASAKAKKGWQPNPNSAKPQAPETQSPQAKTEPTTTPEASGKNPPLSAAAQPNTPGSSGAEPPNKPPVETAAAAPEPEPDPGQTVASTPAPPELSPPAAQVEDQGEQPAEEAEDPQQVQSDIIDTLQALGLDRKSAEKLGLQAMAQGISNAQDGIKEALRIRAGGKPSGGRTAPAKPAPVVQKPNPRLEKDKQVRNYFDKKQASPQGQAPEPRTPEAPQPAERSWGTPPKAGQSPSLNYKQSSSQPSQPMPSQKPQASPTPPPGLDKHQQAAWDINNQGPSRTVWTNPGKPSQESQTSVSGTKTPQPTQSAPQGQSSSTPPKNRPGDPINWAKFQKPAPASTPKNRPAPGWPSARPGTSQWWQPNPSGSGTTAPSPSKAGPQPQAPPAPKAPAQGQQQKQPPQSQTVAQVRQANPSIWATNSGRLRTQRPTVAPSGVGLSRVQRPGQQQVVTPEQLERLLGGKRPNIGYDDSKIAGEISPFKPIPPGQGHGGIHGNISRNPLWKYGIRSQPGQTREVKPPKGHRLTEREIKRAEGKEKEVSKATHFSAELHSPRVLKLMELLK